MLLIQPQKSFLLEHSINNPSDLNTYYVQIVVTDSVSGNTLLTASLGAGNPYWSYSWVTPADTSGTGRQLTLKKTVYTDSAYTTVSTIYGTIYESVMLRSIAGGFGQPLGGFTRGLESSDVERVVRRSLADLPRPKDPIVYDDTNIRALIGALADKLDDAVQSNGVSLTQVESWVADRIKESHDGLSRSFEARLASVLSAIKGIKFPDLPDIPQPIDHAPQIKAVADKLDAVESNNVARHKEALEKIGSPVTLHLPVERFSSKEEKQEPTEREMTVKKLLELSNR